MANGGIYNQDVFNEKIGSYENYLIVVKDVKVDTSIKKSIYNILSFQGSIGKTDQEKEIFINEIIKYSTDDRATLILMLEELSLVCPELDIDLTVLKYLK